METQKQQTNKSLMGELAIAALNTDIRDLPQEIKYIIGRRNPTEQSENKLKTLLRGTPLYDMLKQEEQFDTKYTDTNKTKLYQFADCIRQGKQHTALNLIDSPLKESYVGGRGAPFYSHNVHFFSGNYGNSPYGSDSLEFADLAIVAGRLAKILGKNPTPYYKFAEIGVHDASLTIGGIVCHFGKDGLEDYLTQSVKEIKTRQEIIKKEMEVKNGN